VSCWSLAKDPAAAAASAAFVDDEDLCPLLLRSLEDVDDAWLPEFVGRCPVG